MPTITMLPESQPRQGFVEEGDFRAIVQHLEPGPALAATIAFETAWRIRSEVLTLEWSRVDLTEGCIRLDGAHSKNGQPRRTAYLSPAATKLLVEQRARVEALGRELGRTIPEVFVHTEKGALQGQAPAGVHEGVAVGLTQGRLYWHPAPRSEAVGGASDGASRCA